jgi:predicted nucleic-acid-binding Zn-ribbon protein
MNEARQAKVGGQPLHCPVCNRRAFETHKFMLSYGLGQVFDFHALREQGLMLICEHCSYIQYFARHSLVELEPSTD